MKFKFKFGDKVRIIEGFYEGQVGTVKDYEPGYETSISKFWGGKITRVVPALYAVKLDSAVDRQHFEESFLESISK